MRIEGTVRRRRPVSLTSLIDVIFLLLLFFMLSSTFTRFSEVEISGGRAGTASAEQPDILMRIDGEEWMVNGQRFAADEAIEEMNRLKHNGANMAALLVRGDLTSQTLVSAVERVRRETGLQLFVAR